MSGAIPLAAIVVVGLLVVGCDAGEGSLAPPAAPSASTETAAPAPSLQLKRSVLAGLGKLAFVATVDGQADLYVMNTDGRVNLTNDAAAEGAPAWSPDGTRIAYASDGDLMVMDADGGRTRRLTDLPTNEGTPAWSPDGTKIVFPSRPWTRDASRSTSSAPTAAAPRSSSSEAGTATPSGRTGLRTDARSSSPASARRPAEGCRSSTATEQVSGD